MAAFDDLLATDEDVSIHAPGDYAVLVPSHQRAAFGTDGSLSGWVLTASGGLAGMGAGHVVRIERRTPTWSDLLAVESVDGDEITLRRIGMDAGDGAMPTPAGGSAGLTFEAPTALPQIRKATHNILRGFAFASYAAIAQALDGAGDPEHFRPLATLNVLLVLLGSQHRAGPQEENFHTKYRDLIAERDRLTKDLRDQYGITDAKPLRTGVLRLPSYRDVLGSEF